MGKNLPKFLLVLLVLLFLGFLVEGIYYFQITRVKKQTVVTPPLENASQEFMATANIDVFLKPGGNKVGYFVKGQNFDFTEKKENGYMMIIDSDGNKLWIKEGSPYKLVEKK